MATDQTRDIWADDLLGYASRGDAFTRLVQSIDDHRNISIEAGYGHGKTFFRERWARQLEAAGECVVQIDARLSDHAGDPVVTFLSALLALVPEEEKTKREAAFTLSKRIATAGGKAVARAVLREGLDDMVDGLIPTGEEASTLSDIANAAGQELSKAAGDLIATQLEAEKARAELKEQLRTLHGKITEGKGTDRIIILIDELDRCHPDYAISLLEAMKLVFDQAGFVFVLMVNRGYIENIAKHRFGIGNGEAAGESYLDKFVDLRLKLEAEGDNLSNGVTALASQLPLKIPFGDHEEFSVERAARLAGELAEKSGLSMRQIKRILDRVELALRIYADQPIDVALLVWLGFRDGFIERDATWGTKSLVRSGLTATKGSEVVNRQPRWSDGHGRKWVVSIEEELMKTYPELAKVDEIAAGAPLDGEFYRTWEKVYKFLAPHYIPTHQAMLDSTRTYQIDS